MLGHKISKKLLVGAVFFTSYVSLHALKIVNSTPEAMVVIAQFAQAPDRQDLASNLAGGATATITLQRVPNSIYARDAAFSWTNVPQIATGNRSLEQLNNATLTISAVTPYRKNGAWNIKLDLALAVAGQAQVETKAASAQSSDDNALALFQSEWLASIQRQVGCPVAVRPASEAPAHIQAAIQAHQASVGAGAAGSASFQGAAQAERPAWLAGVERQVGRPLEVRPASEAPAHIQAAIRRHQASLGEPVEQKKVSAQQEAAIAQALQTVVPQFIELRDQARAAIQKRFATAKSVRQLNDGTWLVILPDNSIKIVDMSGNTVLKTIVKGRIQ